MSCFNYFKMLQLHESLFRSLPLFIQKYCATDTVEKFKWLLLQEKCGVPRSREPWAISVAPQGRMPTLGTGFLGTGPAFHPVHQGSSASRIRPRTNSSNFPYLWRAGSWGERPSSPLARVAMTTCLPHSRGTESGFRNRPRQVCKAPCLVKPG
uniref:Uncharacterized protein n=1 Tax=Pipistrellus kuhlii TaxID=59472 RepID=A0A7J7UGM5_PIPKU|nr:hypothetical protein mPipKuh1_009126 [Pipistrellus kuhlii]